MKNRIRSVIAAGLAAAVLALALPGVGMATGWPDFRGGDLDRATAAATPRTASETSLKWKTNLKSAEDWQTNVSDPLIIDGQIYIAVGSQLRVYDEASGTLVKSANLSGAADFTCRPVYSAGKIIVPLKQGVLEAVDTSTLTQAWITTPLPDDPTGGAHQSQTTLVASGGYVYAGTACADWTRSYAGVYQCIKVADGTVTWTHENQGAGYYWSGGVVVNGAFIVAGDDGKLTSFNAVTGDEIAPAIDLGAPVRSTIAVSGNEVFVVSQNGTLHKATVSSSGALTSAGSVSFTGAGGSSTSSPTVYGGKVYIGGGASDYSGVLAVIDAATMKVEQKVSVAAGIQGSPLVSHGSDGVFIYFTQNAEPGALYVYKQGATAASALFTPTGADANYCMSSPIAGDDGTLYYMNDSGNLFALKRTEQPKPPVVPDSVDEEDPTPAPVTPAKPTPISATKATATAEKTKNPQTADSASLALAAGTLGVSAIVVLLVSNRRRQGDAA